MKTLRQNLLSGLTRSVLSAAALLFSCGAVAQIVPLQPGDTRVKWNPGHYIQLPATADDTVINTTLQEIGALRNVRGIQTRYMWRDLEPTKDNYQFGAIERALEAARLAGKRLHIIIGTKAFKAGTHAVPDYLLTPEYNGGVYAIYIKGKDTIGTPDTLGENIAMYEPSVRDRLIALATALGKRFNADNSFEGIAFNETAFGQPVVPLTTEQKNAFFDNLAKVDTATRQAFPNTVVIQFFNFPKAFVPKLVNNALLVGVGLGGPDTFLNDADLEYSTYPHYDTAAGRVPLGPSVQGENYVSPYQNGPYAPPAVTDLYAFAKGRLHANYIFWNRTLTPPLVPYNNVLAMFKSATFPQWGAGGLNNACPSMYVSCVPKL